MSELGTVNFKVFNDNQIKGYSDRDQIKKEIIEKLPDQHAKFETQILPYVKTYLNNDILDNFFKNTLKTSITKIYNNKKIEKILNTINESNVFTLDDLTNNINHDTDIINIEIKSSLVKSKFPFIIALKTYIGNLIKLLNLLKDNEENIKNIYALANNQRIKVDTKESNHKFTNLYHSFNDITLDELKAELILFQNAYNNIQKFINGDDSKYRIKYVEEYIKNIKNSQKDLITSLKDINNDFDYTKDTPHSIFAGKITDDNKNEYENILNLLEDITANKALLEQINKSKKDIKIYLDHHNEDKEVKVIELVESTRDIEIDKQLKAFNNSQFDTETLLTPFNKATSKLPAYLNNIIIIIIFLIFLNLFITTYFYFTTSIEATANRSNCGGASLCEAETHRHLFLEDNGNDKARDIYIIIVVIFSIYLLSEIFKNSKDGINFNNTDTEINFIKKVFIFVCFFGSMLLAQFAKYYFDKHKNKQNFSENIKNPPMFGFMIAYSVLSVLAIIICFLIAYLYGQSSRIIKIIMGIIVFISLGYDIHNFINKSTSDSFESKSFNSKFKAETAIDILLITFYSISIVVLFVLRDVNNITIPIVALSLLAVLMATLYIFILNSSVDWSRNGYNSYYDRYFEIFHRSIFVISGTFPVLLAFFFSSESNIIKLIVFYYAILFIIYLFYVYFINHNNESGILSLAYFQLYNYLNIQKNENTKGSDNTVYKFTTEDETNDETKNYYKQFNQINVYFVVVLLIILIIIGGLNKDSNLDNIIYGIIAFIIASYITGSVYLLYNTVFPIQQASFNYKKNLVDINNEISQYIKVEDKEHTIDKNKIRVFKIANDVEDIKKIHERIKHPRIDGTTDKEKHMKNIRDIFSEISPKGSSYEDYRSQSTDQMQYEEYIYLLFSDSNNSNIITQYNFSYYSNLLVQKNRTESNFSYEVPSLIASSDEDLYNQIILNVPYKISDIDYDIGIKINTYEYYLSNLKLNIPVTNNIEYVIKKNYKYVTGEEGEIQKYNVLSEKELSCLYYSSNVARSADLNNNNSNLKISIEESIKNYDNTKFKITNIATDTGVKTNDNYQIYKLNQDIFDDFKVNYDSNIGQFTFELGSEFYNNMDLNDVKKEEKLNPAFYTIGYDYENYIYNDQNHQQMNKDTAYSIPARYYACSYLNYFPNEDGSMSKVKFAKNIKENNYNPLNTTNTIVDRIAKSYNANAEETKIQLAPEKFQFLLVFLVILAIILLMFLFNIIKKYFTGDVYTPQMYVLGILGVFLTIFIFGEVIFARIK